MESPSKIRRERNILSLRKNNLAKWRHYLKKGKDYNRT